MTAEGVTLEGVTLERGTRLPGGVVYDGQDGNSAEYEMRGTGMWVKVDDVVVHLYRPFGVPDTLGIEVFEAGHESCPSLAEVTVETAVWTPCPCAEAQCGE